MDRFKWCCNDNATNADDECLILTQDGIRLYDGVNRSSFEDGIVRLTTHRLIWQHSSAVSSSPIALPLSAIIGVKREEGGGLIRYRTPKLVLSLLTLPSLANALRSLPRSSPWMAPWLAADSSFGAVVSGSSAENFIKLGFTRTGQHEFERAIEEALKAKVWTVSASTSSTDILSSRSAAATGISAIAREQAARVGANDRLVEESFNDLKPLMSKAGEIVELSRLLAKRVNDAKGEECLSGDETAQLRSIMLSVGVVGSTDSAAQSASSSADPTHSFHRQLAHQIGQLFGPLLEKRSAGAGCLDLASAYCWLNRARGMQLVSPDDLLSACSWLERDRLPVRLKRFPSGLMILQLASEDERATLQATNQLVSEKTSLSADELARLTGVSPLLARERLLAIEEAGMACRDDSEAGLRFFLNWFSHGPPPQSFLESS